jgi:hypothetical protein
MNRNRILNRALKPDWLDVAFRLACSSGETDRRVLDLALSDEKLAKGARGKVVEVVAPVWLTPPPETARLVAWALANTDPTADLRALHLLVLMATYPFFGDVCATVGRLLRLNGEIGTGDLRERLRAKWGDREVIQVAQRKCVQTLRDFGAVHAHPRSTVSYSAPPLPLPAGMSIWAIHALVLSRDAESIDLIEVDGAPELFFTRLEVTTASAYPLLERFSQGAGRAQLVLTR